MKKKPLSWQHSGPKKETFFREWWTVQGYLQITPKQSSMMDKNRYWSSVEMLCVIT